MTALTTSAKVSNYLTGHSTPTAGTITQAIEGLSVLFESLTDRVFSSTAYTEYHDGDGTAEIIVENYPMISVTSLHIDGAREFGATTLVAAADYSVYLSDGLINLHGYVTVRGSKTIKLIYVAGYATIPADIDDVIAQAAAQLIMREEQGQLHLAAIRSGGTNAQLAVADLPKEFRRLIVSKQRKDSGIG